MRTHDGQLPRYRIIFEKRRRGEMRDEQGNRLDNPTDIPISEQPVVIWIDDGNQLPPKTTVYGWRIAMGADSSDTANGTRFTWPAEFP